MASCPKSWLALALGLVSLVSAQQKARPSPAPQHVAVEIEYCGMHPAKPPLKLLSFDITVRNPAPTAQWVLFPRALYETAQEAAQKSGVNGVEVFSNRPQRSVTVAQFMGSVRLQPESAGGFQALLLPANAVISIRDFGIHFVGDHYSPLPLRIVIANEVDLGKTPADRWAGANLLSKKSADVSTRQIAMVRSRFTRLRSEIPVTIDKASEITIPNALANSCSPAPSR